MNPAMNLFAVLIWAIPLLVVCAFGFEALGTFSDAMTAGMSGSLAEAADPTR